MTAIAPKNDESSERVESPLRFVTVASLFDGHDAAINVMRRLIQDRSCPYCSRIVRAQSPVDDAVPLP